MLTLCHSGEVLIHPASNSKSRIGLATVAQQITFPKHAGDFARPDLSLSSVRDRAEANFAADAVLVKEALAPPGAAFGLLPQILGAQAGTERSTCCFVATPNPRFAFSVEFTLAIHPMHDSPV